MSPVTGVRDLSSRLPPHSKPKERIALIGVELEGGWTSLPPGVAVTHDGSVRNLVAPASSGGPSITSAQIEAIVADRFAAAQRVRRFTQAMAESMRQELRQQVIREASSGRPPLQTGEIPSPIMPPAELEAWMRRHYPQVVNDTCGLHVHMSFKNALHYQRLMVQSYQDTLFHYITVWATAEKLPADHPIWPRLRGESRFCRHDFWPDLQVIQREKSHDQQRTGHRYTALNFCHGTHGTVECRLLPMMTTPDQGIRAVQLILDVTNAFLGKYKLKEEKVRTEVVGDVIFQSTRSERLFPERREASLS